MTSSLSLGLSWFISLFFLFTHFKFIYKIFDFVQVNNNKICMCATCKLSTFSLREYRVTWQDLKVIPSLLRFQPGFLNSLWQMPGWLMRRLLLVSGFCAKFVNYFLSFDGNLWSCYLLMTIHFDFFFFLFFLYLFLLFVKLYWCLLMYCS